MDSYSVFCSLVLLILPFTCVAQPEQRFRQIVDSVYKANPAAVGMILHVESPDRHISWTYAVGYADKEHKQIIKKDQPANIASNTKTYVAAAILKLVESNHLELDGPIKNVLSPARADQLVHAGYNTGAITVRHLLSHTSGIRDYVDSAYFEYVNKHRGHYWTRDEQIALAMTKGQPLWTAGADFKYADVNYLLLSEIIERKTGKLFYIAIRDLLGLERLGLKHTRFLVLEPKHKSDLPLAHQYSTKYNWDAYQLHPSWDLYGGGGMAATANDLCLFFQYLFERKIIRDSSILAQAYDYVLPPEKSSYCLGVRNFKFGERTAYYHGGFWGTDAMYLPATNTSIAVFTLTREQRDLNAKVSELILQAIEQRNQ